MAAVETEPPAVGAVFGDRVDLARRYVEHLAGAGVERGLIGPREAGRLWTRHVLNCAAIATLVPRETRVVDIGSGAGLPGIVLGLARPDLTVDLVEPLLRRATFLSEVIEDLSLTGCRVVRARAEDAAATVGGAGVVTARAVAPLARLSRWAAPLLAPGGLLIAIKGRSAPDEVARDAAAAARAGIGELSVESVRGAGSADEAAGARGRVPGAGPGDADDAANTDDADGAVEARGEPTTVILGRRVGSRTGGWNRKGTAR